MWIPKLGHVPTPDILCLCRISRICIRIERFGKDPLKVRQILDTVDCSFRVKCVVWVDKMNLCWITVGIGLIDDIRSNLDHLQVYILISFLIT